MSHLKHSKLKLGLTWVWYVNQQILLEPNRLNFSFSLSIDIRKFVAFENTGGDTKNTGQIKQRVVEVSWCSFYLIGRIFGLFLVLTGLILIIMVALSDNNPSNSDSTNSIAISDDNTNCLFEFF